MLDSATMTSVLIHIPHAYGKPAGAWRVEDGKLVCHYDIDSPLGDTVRARVALAARGTDVPLDDWFHQLASKTPYFDDYEVIEAPPDQPLTDILIQAQQAWTE